MELSRPLPILPCPTCGALGVPQVSPGTGPYVAKASCSTCGRFMKWLPRALVQPSGKERPGMVASVNRVVLLGEIGRYGVTVSYQESGPPRAAFTLVVQDQSQDGKAFHTLVACQIFGKKAAAAGELEAGQLVLFEGKLAKRKKGEQWELCVSGYELTPLSAPVPTLTGTNT
jgi:hypothetical protein